MIYVAAIRWQVGDDPILRRKTPTGLTLKSAESMLDSNYEDLWKVRYGLTPHNASVTEPDNDRDGYD